MTLPARVGLLVAAALVAAWLLGDLGAVRDLRAGIGAVDVGRAATPAQLARAERLLREAAAGTRSSEPELRLAQLEAFAGRPERSVTIARGIVAREPENLDAWRLLTSAARRHDPALAAEARARVARLSPPVPADG